MISSLVKLRRAMPAAVAVRSISASTSGIGRGLPVLVVDVPAGAGLLPEVIHRHELIGDERLALRGIAELVQLLAHAPGDVEPAHVVHGEDAHRHAPVGERLVHLRRRGAVLGEELRLVHVGEHHPVADEPGAVADDHADFAEALGQRLGGGDRLGRGGRAAHDLDQPHHVGRAEEVGADDRLRPLRHAGQRVDVERGRVGGEQRAGTGHGVELRQHLLLERHALEHGLDDDVGAGRSRPRPTCVEIRPMRSAADSGVKRPFFTELS